jgi:two-component system cell cycle sensor histidine kinase/response regulator CckA
MSLESEFTEFQPGGSEANAEGTTGLTRRVTTIPNFDEIFRQMADNIQEIFWMLDAATFEVIYVSPAFEKICGLPCQRLYDAPTSYREIIHPDDRVRVLDLLEQLPRTGKLDEEFRIVRTDGVVPWVHAIGFLARDSAGNVTRLVGTVQDITKRKAAEDQLRGSEERYRDLVENSEDLICTHDLGGRLLSVNEAAARILGYEPDDLKKKPMREFLSPQFRHQFDEYLARLLRDGFAKGLLTVQTRNGEKRIWRYSNTLRTVGVSEPIVRGIAHDITDLKRAEKALKLSEEKFSRAFQASPVAMSISSAGDGRFMEVNESFVKQSGYSSEELIGHADMELDMWCEPLAREHVMQQMGIRGKLRDFEMKFRTKSGVVLDTKFSAEFIELQSGLSVLTVAEDITERKNAEEALRRSEADYRSLFEGVPHGVFRATPDGRFLVVNPALVRMLGFPSQTELLRANLVADIFAESAEHEIAMRECCKRERFEDVELRWKRRDGKPLRVLASGRLVRDEAGEFAYCEVMVEDITERRALEEQVRRSQKMDAIALLANGISHDFNTLLTGILGYGELLLMSSNLPDSERRKVEAIVDAAVQARSITQQLVAVGRRQALKPTVVSLNRVINDLSDFLKRLVGPGIDISFNLQEDSHNVEIDPTQLTQVIMNLVANARDAMPHGGKLTINTYTRYPDLEEYQPTGAEQARHAVLVISDTGVGMDGKVQARLFEPFFTTKAEGKGTGLGLAVVHGIIEQHRGHIRVSSRPDEGTTFKIYLPTTQERIAEAKMQRPEGSSASGCETVLVVDDNDLARRLTLDFLRSHGYEVLCARGGREAIEVAKKHRGPIHLLTTDIVMPRMSGPDLVKRLTVLHPETKVLYMTAYADLMDFADLAGVGEGPEFLRKPFMQHELVGKVRQMLGQSTPH